MQAEYDEGGQLNRHDKRQRSRQDEQPVVRRPPVESEHEGSDVGRREERHVRYHETQHTHDRT